VFAEGNGADPTFWATYFGIEIAVDDEQTDDLVLDVAGETGTSLDGFQYGLYGSCPSSHGFDRLSLATPAPNSVGTVLAAYTDGGVADDGRAAIIANVRTGGGVAVHLAFDLAAQTSDEARACILHNLITGNLGLASTGYVACVGAVDVPIVAGGPRSFALSRVAPNPFRTGTTIEFQVPRPANATIRVYDVAGRVVRTLLDDAMPPGTHRTTWDGRGDDARAVSSGIYFVRMTSGDFHATSRIVRVR
jgi:hypothetical protein